jgi:hypothetical protein
MAQLVTPPPPYPSPPPIPTCQILRHSSRWSLPVGAKAWTPLCLALEQGHAGMVPLLLAHAKKGKPEAAGGEGRLRAAAMWRPERGPPAFMLADCLSASSQHSGHAADHSSLFWFQPPLSLSGLAEHVNEVCDGATALHR